MSVNTSKPSNINAGDMQTAEKIVGESSTETDWTDLVEFQNWLYANGGFRLGGRRWNWQTTSTSATVVNDLADEPDLDSWSPATRMTRPKDNGDLALVLAFHGADVTVDWEIIRRNSDGTRDSVGTITFSRTSSTTDWAVNSTTAFAPVHKDFGNSGNRPVRLEHSLQAYADGDGATALLNQTVAWAAELSTSQLPRK